MSDKPSVDPGWTKDQREFVKNLQDVGARNPKAAVKIDRTMSLPKAELEGLLKSGAVVEVSVNRFYTTFPGRRERLEAAMGTAQTDARPDLARPFKARKLMMTMLFWILMILIPIVIMQLADRAR
jgi:hypothetical protein